MSNLQPENQNSPPILAYSKARKDDPQRKWILPGYALGLLGTGLLQGVVFGAIERSRAMPGDSLAGLSGILAPAAASIFLGLIPGSILLGLTMWIKKKIFREVRFARMRWAILAGALAGAPPLAPYAMEGFTRYRGTVMLAALGWYALVPIVAGLMLCYRSAIQD